MNNFIMVCLTCLLVSCGSYQATTQVDESALLQLSGNYLGTQLQIDGENPISIDKNTKAFKLNGENVVRFTLQHGSHEIKIYRSGVVLVNRKIYVSEGNIFEMRVP